LNGRYRPGRRAWIKIGTKAEGLLMNVRMVNAIFEDQRRPDFSPEASTDKFIARIHRAAPIGGGP